MSPKRRPELSVALIGAPHGADDGGDGEKDGAGDGARDDAKDAMDMFIEAVHAKDTDGALAAYEQLHDFCAAKDDEDEGADEDEKAEGEGRVPGDY